MRALCISKSLGDANVTLLHVHALVPSALMGLCFGLDPPSYSHYIMVEGHKPLLLVEEKTVFSLFLSFCFSDVA